jgi:hypothetical protein
MVIVFVILNVQLVLEYTQNALTVLAEIVKNAVSTMKKKVIHALLAILDASNAMTDLNVVSVKRVSISIIKTAFSALNHTVPNVN